MKQILRTLSVVAALSMGAWVSPLAAQGAGGNFDPRRAELTRPELEQLLSDLEQTAASPAYSDRLRARARNEALLVKRRLEQGDLQVGDRVLLTVEGEAQLSDTFVVETGRVLTLPVIGSVRMAGVLRSELQAHLTQAISRYLRDPVIHAQSLMRLSITGAVAQPGFYTLPTNLVITDALMAAGGPSTTAVLDKITVERGRERLWEGEAMQQALTDGRTLDQMYLQAGDRIVVPQRTPGAFGSTIRTVSIGIGLVISVYGIVQLVN